MGANSLQTWLITPHDPLVFRDGKPFTAIPGSRARSMPFPSPATLAGAVRTRSAALDNGGRFPTGDQNVINRILGFQVIGPLLFDVRRQELLVPAPRDALFVQLEQPDEARARLMPLRPWQESQEVLTNLPAGLRLVGPISSATGKEHSKAPQFWRWERIEAWLRAPEIVESANLHEWGLQRLPMDTRTHVSIERGTGTAREGALFQTSGLTLLQVPQRGRLPALSESTEFAFVVQTDAQPFAPGLDTLGGERRVVWWQACDRSIPSCPEEIRRAILEIRRGRLILVTPAWFEKGYMPEWLLQHPTGVKLKIVGAAVGRPTYASGWDYAKKAPKPARRLAPAGSVYFFEITQGSETAIERFIDSVWMKPISDGEQERRDGFGVALLGTWLDEEA
ncbi:MAG: type III-B CRISPR module-associated protein Cmr3 [Anaerolineae bacterium]